MEITNEIKQKLVYQYLGQKYFYKNEFGTYGGIVGEYHTNEHIKNEFFVLRLKSLSEITDEDAIEVCKLQQEFKGQNGIKVGFDIDIKNNGCLDCIIEWDKHKHDCFQPIYSPTYQFLQSKATIYLNT
ncbi:MAG: hypothetical protein IPJ01_10210 [Micavibrio sp.]|nr:hypothetical protein [Micavibrio sp.]